MSSEEEVPMLEAPDLLDCYQHRMPRPTAAALSRCLVCQKSVLTVERVNASL
jgi:hypothetical protein